MLKNSEISDDQNSQEKPLIISELKEQTTRRRRRHKDREKQPDSKNTDSNRYHKSTKSRRRRQKTEIEKDRKLKKGEFSLRPNGRNRDSAGKSGQDSDQIPGFKPVIFGPSTKHPNGASSYVEKKEVFQFEIIFL